MNVSFHVANIWHTAKRSPETFCGPRFTTPFCTSWSYPSAFLVLSSFAAGALVGFVSSFAGFYGFAYFVAAGAGFAT